jgi:hypothetical protein
MKRLAFAALLLLAASAAGAQTADERAFATIDACIGRLDPLSDIGFEKIAARCPDLAPTLERTGWAAWLPEGWKDSRNDLSPGSLTELRTLVEAELRNKTVARAPRVERLEEILSGLGSAGAERGGLWARFKQWVRSVFTPGEEENDSSWLDRMIGRGGLSQTVVELITYVALGLIVLLAALIVVNEVRASGVLRAREKRDRQAEAELQGALRMNVTWQDVDRAPLLDKPRLLLEMVASRLVALGQLPPAAALTVREITQAAQLPNDEDRARLAQLALVAERVRYAPESLASSGLESAVDDGRLLLSSLAPTHDLGAVR